jgi:hypothetical protein
MVPFPIEKLNQSAAIFLLRLERCCSPWNMPCVSASVRPPSRLTPRKRGGDRQARGQLFGLTQILEAVSRHGRPGCAVVPESVSALIRERKIHQYSPRQVRATIAASAQATFASDKLYLNRLRRAYSAAIAVCSPSFWSARSIHSRVSFSGRLFCRSRSFRTGKSTRSSG